MLSNAEPMSSEQPLVILVCVPQIQHQLEFLNAMKGQCTLVGGQDLSESCILLQLRPTVAKYDIGDTSKYIQEQIVGQKRNISLLVTVGDLVQEDFVAAMDGVILVLDGNAGVTAQQIQAWNWADDHSIPRHVCAINVVGGRTDFDELHAIALRVLDSDLLVRYLPIVTDAEDGVAGLYDLLTTDIHENSAGSVTIRSSEAEHLALTSEQREVLIEEIVHFGPESLLNAHLENLPISVPALCDIWDGQGIVAMTPLQDGAGSQVVHEWIMRVPSRWEPVIIVAGQTFPIHASQTRIGVGVSATVARMWGPLSEEQLHVEHFAHTEGPMSTEDSLQVSENSQIQNKVSPAVQTVGCLLDPKVKMGDVLTQGEHKISVLLPRF